MTNISIRWIMWFAKIKDRVHAMVAIRALLNMLLSSESCCSKSLRYATATQLELCGPAFNPALRIQIMHAQVCMAADEVLRPLRSQSIGAMASEQVVLVSDSIVPANIVGDYTIPTSLQVAKALDSAIQTSMSILSWAE